MRVQYELNIEISLLINGILTNHLIFPFLLILKYLRNFIKRFVTFEQHVNIQYLLIGQLIIEYCMILQFRVILGYENLVCFIIGSEYFCRIKSVQGLKFDFVF